MNIIEWIAAITIITVLIIVLDLCYFYKGYTSYQRKRKQDELYVKSLRMNSDCYRPNKVKNE